MPTIMRNGVPFGGGGGTGPILTWAEYQALEQAGLVDPNVDYHILDRGVTGVMLDDDDISPNKVWSSEKIGKYSTTEKVVGEWIDGKPIYRRVFELTMPTTAGTWGIDALSDDIDTIIKQDITVYRNIGNNTIGHTKLRYYEPTNISNEFITYDIQQNTSTGVTNILLRSGSSAVATGMPIILILEYTKTTDPTPT